jgi:alpha-mannosidase
MSELGMPEYHRGSYLSIGQRTHRLAERLAEITLWRDRAELVLDSWLMDGTPLALGAAWPDRSGVHELAAAEVIVPDEWPLHEVRLDLSLGGEGLVGIDMAGTVDRFGLDPYHHRFPVRGRSLAVDVRIVARRPFGEPNREPRLDRARLVWVDTAVDEFAALLTTLLEAVAVLGEHEAVEPILGCAERALAVLDWPSRTDDYVARAAASVTLQEIWELPADLAPNPPGLTGEERASVVRGTEQLRDELTALRSLHPPRGAVLFSGHAHLDMAWLWPLNETHRKARRTAWTVVNLMRAYPEFTFNQSSAQLYRFIGEDDPELLEAIAKAVGAGQWEPIGGMWVEPDGNLPCGESFVRQLLYGQHAFEELFGARHRIGWLPDTFGLSPGLPQIFASAGIDSLFSQKLNRADTNRFPHDLYWWEGLDGTRLLVHGFDNPNGSYDAMLGPDAMVRTWQNYRGKHVHPETLITIGYGDGGGGPTAEMIERSRDLEPFPVLPKAEFGRVADLFERLHATADRDPLPVWVGELYLEFHRGTYTAQGRIKRLHRRAERALVAAEALGTLRTLLTGERTDSLATAWQTLLLNQFHDILPGSSIREVNLEAEEQLSAVLARAGAETTAHVRALAAAVVEPGERDGVLVVHPDLAPRPLRLELDAPVPGAQAVDGGSVVATAASVAGLEVVVAVELDAAPGLRASVSQLENDFVRVDIDETGALARVYDKQARREVLAGRGNQLWAYVDKPRLYDAWEIDAS